jgi:hypothetical protein
MKTKLLRVLFFAGLLAVFGGCVVYDDGENYGVTYGDAPGDPYFYDPWYEGYHGGEILTGPPPRPANLPAPPPTARPR